MELLQFHSEPEVGETLSAFFKFYLFHIPGLRVKTLFVS